ncbi:hypothetical protein BHM03_00009191 [Ensete ventricosum]|nr:hypothetical protein BHM03_00009191 [Ensete ventricosum]
MALAGYPLPLLLTSIRSPSFLFLPQVSSFPFLVERQSGRSSRKPRVLLHWKEIQVKEGRRRATRSCVMSSWSSTWPWGFLKIACHQ